ncbi:putative oxidoreductase [Rhodococcus opacus B4]|uniref:Putative oxidoreductase n=1 Tax=Rhodococcus opacus (strain B4) TaxID=632772 RepID=C1AX52_RHOOB|nr:putative oxidoreductase [Rhodococcus opacus B4]
MDELAESGYRFPFGDDGREVRTSLQGPEYMRRMRRRVHRAGVTILDHSPALELLTTGDGVVATGGCAAGPGPARHPRGHADVATELLSAAEQGGHRPVHAEVSRAGGAGGNGGRNRRHRDHRNRLRH